MDNRMLERIIIIILVLLNLFLLAEVLTDRTETYRNEAEIRNYMTEVLAEYGLTVAEDADLVQTAPAGCVLLRSSETEMEIIRGILGQSSAEDMGGNIMFYRNDKGQALFRGNGELTTLFSSGEFPLRGNAEKTAQRMLKRAGMDAASAEELNTDGVVSFYCCQNGYPVYNAVLQFDYYDNGLYMLSGFRIFDTVTEVSSAQLQDSVSALMSFVKIVNEEGIICSRIDSIQAGYLQSVQVSGESLLVPVWRLETDAGVVLINAETGKLESGAA